MNCNCDVNSPPLGGKSFFRLAKKQSRLSNYSYKVGACLVVGNRIIPGHNKNKTHPKVANPRFHTKATVHAELDCILKARGNSKIVNGTLYVYRETADGVPALSKPCEHCMDFIRKSGIKRVYYTTNTYPFWAVEEVK